ncbi:mortality factor 4-like protein 1 [Trichosurus vulpecula]|uniref:mortality factor 4-like protein 1 n=1 Tax=Trichosurus vulpecula TaxID=9337 RepID=UPI00186B582E|nr:mortality factor 4-like protein 1 [Trichosurus vulpecula]
MAFSKPESSPVRDLPIFLAGEMVLIFQGPNMRKAHCIWVDVENNQVKYLVRYPSESEIAPVRSGAAAFSSAPFWRHPPPQIRPTPSGPRLWPIHSSSQGSAMCLGTPRSDYSQSMVLGRGGRGLGLPVAPQVFSQRPMYPVAPHGWAYDWLSEGNVLRFTAAYMQRDRHAYVLLQIAAERKQHQTRPVTASWSTAHCYPTEDRAVGGAVAQPSLVMGRGYAGGRGNMPWRDRDATAGPEKESLGRQQIEVLLPQALRCLLVQDWELVTLEKKFFILPARKTVHTILSEYAAFHPNHRSRDKKRAVSGLVALIKEYFDMVLGTQLLYSFERPQHAEVLARYPTYQMSQIYGGIHLLRLFPQMGSMLASTPLSEGNLNVLLSHLQDFLEYLARHPSQLFTAATDYQVASAEYQKKAE